MAEISDTNLRRISDGTHDSVYETLGAHLLNLDGEAGARFGVWAPHARLVSVIGDFNGWNPEANPLEQQGKSGIWSGLIRGVKQGSLYKFSMAMPGNHSRFDRSDPYAFATEQPPGTASKVWNPRLYEWGDQA